MNADQILGPLRAILPVVMTLLTAWGVLPKEIADQIPDAVYAAVLAVCTIVTLWSAIASWYSNRTTKMAEKVGASLGVTVVVGDHAPPEMLELAADPKALGVVKS